MAATVQGKKAAPVKAVAKRAPVRRPKPEPAAESPGGLQVLRLKTSGSKGAMVPLFYIDDREYCIPAKPGLNIALQALHVRRTQGEDAAVDYMLEKVLGAEGYRALREYDELEPGDLMQILQVVNELVMGAMEFPKA
jgi:hypothetical protein